MEYEVQILNQAKEFLGTININLQAKAFRTIKLLQEFGPFLGEPHSKKITGYKGLLELRVKHGSDICRLFYFHYKGKVYVVTSGYMKKDNKLKKSELEKARKMMKLFMEADNE